jgi:hypothetical protein
MKKNYNEPILLEDVNIKQKIIIDKIYNAMNRLIEFDIDNFKDNIDNLNKEELNIFIDYFSHIKHIVNNNELCNHIIDKNITTITVDTTKEPYIEPYVSVDVIDNSITVIDEPYIKKESIDFHLKLENKTDGWLYDNTVVIADNNTYDKRIIIKEAGFKWSFYLKKWYMSFNTAKKLKFI